MRNKILLAMSVAGMMCSATAFAEGDTATASGKITAIGTITNAPCDIKPGDDALTVDFKQVSNKRLKEAATPDTLSTQYFSIHLVNCSFEQSSNQPPTNLLSKVSVSFPGNSLDTSNKYFTNNPGAGMAENVGLELLNGKGQPITPATGVPDQQLTAGDSNAINLAARLVNTGAAGSVTTGKVEIPVTYTLTYH
ncbi:fimbrial protein StdA [Salmonella enterica]|nr:fimbrial protein StdA [Salmonella enterica]